VWQEKLFTVNNVYLIIFVSASNLYGDFIFSNTETGAILGDYCVPTVRDFKLPQCVNEVFVVLGSHLAFIGD
jgi:hypothetical protein